MWKVLFLTEGNEGFSFGLGLTSLLFPSSASVIGLDERRTTGPGWRGRLPAMNLRLLL